MKAPEASEVKTDPIRSVGRAGVFSFFFLLLLLVGSPCGAQTAQPGEIRLPVLSNSLDGRVIGAPEDAFLPVWKPIESNNGEVSYIDMKSIERGAAGMQVQVYTSVPNTMFDMDKLRVLAFDCQGHFMPFDEEGMTEWMDAPPRSVAGEIAETVCVNPSVPGPAQSNTMQPFISANGRFSILFHAIPQQFPQPIHLKSGKTGTAYVFYARADNNKTGDYVTYTDYSPDVIASASPQVLLQRSEKGFVAGKTLLTEQVIDLDGVPGRAYTATDSDGNFYTAHEFLAGTRIYQVLVLTTKSNFPSGQDNGQFLNSFIILGNPPHSKSH